MNYLVYDDHLGGRLGAQLGDITPLSISNSRISTAFTSSNLASFLLKVGSYKDYNVNNTFSTSYFYFLNFLHHSSGQCQCSSKLSGNLAEQEKRLQSSLYNLHLSNLRHDRISGKIISDQSDKIKTPFKSEQSSIPNVRHCHCQIKSRLSTKTAKIQPIVRKCESTKWFRHLF